MSFFFSSFLPPSHSFFLSFFPFFLLFSLLMPAALKSPVASLLPDVASRCGLELFQADKGCRDYSQSPGFSSSLVQWGLSNAFPLLLPFLH